MATRAQGAFKTLLQRGDGATPENFVTVSEVKDINGPEISQIIEDATSMDSPGWEEKVAVGLRSAGDITFQMNFLQDDATQAGVRQDLTSSTLRNWRVVFKSQTKRLAFAGYVARIGPSYPVKGIMMQDCTITPTGEIRMEPHP